MSGGLSWAYEKQEEEYRAKCKAIFDKLTPYSCETILECLLELDKEPMTKQGHRALDTIFEKLGRNRHE